jgi:ubiquinone/menaquinone biosynthesis C-methylase UbiE
MAERKEKDYWGKFAARYDEYAEYVVGRALREILFKRLLEEDMLGVVVEFGCGTGYFTVALAPHATCITATDISEEMLKATRDRLKEFPNVILEKVDCESTPFPAESFDTVFMANLIHIIGDPGNVLLESHRVMKKGGLLLVASYTDYGLSWFEKMELGLRYFAKFGFPPLRGIRNYSPSELRRLLEGAGFEVGEIQLLGGGPKALYARGRKR